MTMSTMKPRVTSFAPQFLVDDLERSIGREKRRRDFRLGTVESKHTWRLLASIGILGRSAVPQSRRLPATKFR